MPISITSFAESIGPADWTNYYLEKYLSPEIIGKVIYHSSDNGRNDLFKQEIMAVTSGATILYKANGKDEILIRISWQQSSPLVETPNCGCS